MLFPWKFGGSARHAQLPTRGEQWLVTVASFWLFTGLFLDGWAHNHIPELESFFTPWHGVFYSGYAAIVLSFLFIVWRHARQSRTPFFSSIPDGYDFALIGCAGFLLGGIGDMLWHEVFGIEVGVEALLSPTHLVLAASGFLMMGANLRVWFRTTPASGTPRLVVQLPMLLSLFFCFTLPWFMVQFSHFVRMRAGGIPNENSVMDIQQNVAITGYLLHTIFLMGALFIVLRKGRLASGAITLLFTASMVAMGWMLYGLILIPAAFIAGVVADLLASGLHPLEKNRGKVRLFGFLVPVVFFAGYFLTIYLNEGIWWSVHLWTGSIMMAGLAGILVSFVAVPPQQES